MLIWGIEIGPAVLSVVATVLAGLILAWFQPKVKIIWSEPHEWTFLVRPPGHPAEPLFNVHTRSVYVQNIGRQPAEGVEVIFNWQPDNYNLWPILPHTTEYMEDGRFIIRANNLGRQEWFQIEMLGTNNLPATVRVRSREGDGKLVKARVMRVFPSWIIFGFLALALLGVFAIIYHMIEWLLRIFG